MTLIQWACSAAMLLAICGCGNSGPEISPAEANRRLDEAVKLARLHVRHQEYDKAEVVLEEALAGSTATRKRDAFELLDRVKVHLATTAGKQSVTAGQSAALPHAIPEPAAQSAAKPVAAAGTDAAVPAVPHVPARQPVPAPEPTADATPQQPGRSDRPAIAPPPEEPLEKTPADDQSIDELVSHTHAAASPTEALAGLAEFLARHTLTAEQMRRVEQQIASWEERKQQALVRLGTEWVPQAEAREASERANDLLTRGLQALEQGERAVGIRLLERASEADRGGIRGDFLLGLIHLHSIDGVIDPVQAGKHFRNVVGRAPHHVAALNNAALAEIKLREFTEAWRHWKRAVELAPTTREVSQNLGRVLSEVQQGKLSMLPAVRERFDQLYREATANHAAPAFSPSVGWLYMPPVLPKVELGAEEARRSQDTRQPHDRTGEPVPVGSGSGFLIAKGYVLTNRHVIEDDQLGTAHALRVIDPADPGGMGQFDAEVAAVSDELDLALVKCERLAGVPLSLAREPAELGSEIMVLGYSRSDRVARLQSALGVVTGLPDRGHPIVEIRGMLLVDAEASSGNSGGPIFNNRGAAIGVLTKIAGGLEGPQVRSSFAIPSTTALKFVRQHIEAHYDEGLASGEPREWAEVVRQAAPSAVMLLRCYRTFAVQPQVTKVAEPGAALPEGSLEDRSCSVCNGLANLNCPAKGCVKGQVAVYRPVRQVIGSGENRRVIIRQMPFKQACQACRGAGRVDCTHCRDGIDPSLRGY
ncbi:MAG: trypsin-like peptidase domain-containing protein [Planctomycetes bacterium]|nr:trypsin-like peptidase domain-containing protein [Planctomycetota bacterium]